MTTGSASGLGKSSASDIYILTWERLRRKLATIRRGVTSAIKVITRYNRARAHLSEALLRRLSGLAKRKTRRVNSGGVLLYVVSAPQPNVQKTLEFPETGIGKRAGRLQRPGEFCGQGCPRSQACAMNALLNSVERIFSLVREPPASRRGTARSISRAVLAYRPSQPSQGTHARRRGTAARLITA